MAAPEPGVTETAIKKVVNATQLDGAMTNTAAAIRDKTGSAAQIPWDASKGFADAIAAIQPPEESDINFYDYDGTLLHSWTLAELAEKTELPPLPSHPGLVCEGWNWTLDELKSENGEIDVGAMYITDDGKTRIYIHLDEGRLSPMVGLGTNGAIVVDWGDGTEPYTLTGETAGNTVYTPTHTYAAAGDYIITLERVSGVLWLKGTEDVATGACILRHSASADNRNAAYRSSINKVEIGSVDRIDVCAFNECRNIESITIQKDTICNSYAAFAKCTKLGAITIRRSETSVAGNFVSMSESLRVLAVPKSVVTYGSQIAYSTKIKRIKTSGINAIGDRTYGSLLGLKELTLEEGITRIPTGMCQYTPAMRRISIKGAITSIGTNAFYGCESLVSIKIPGSPNSIGASAFTYCYSLKVCDLTDCTAVPTLANANAFTGIPDDCEIRVPASLVDAWKAATNWSTYADHIVGVET